MSNIANSSKNKESFDNASESSNESDLETKKIILFDEINKIRNSIENKEDIDLEKTIEILKQVSKLTLTDYNRVYEEQNETIDALKLINLNLACEAQYYKGCLCKELLQSIKEWFNELIDFLVFLILELSFIKKLISLIRNVIPGFILNILQTLNFFEKIHPKNWPIVQHFFTKFILPLIFLTLYFLRLPILRTVCDLLIIYIITIIFFIYYLNYLFNCELTIIVLQNK